MTFIPLPWRSWLLVLLLACPLWTVAGDVHYNQIDIKRDGRDKLVFSMSLNVTHLLHQVLAPQTPLIDFLKLPVIALYYLLAWLSPWSMWVVPLAGALHCMGVVDFTWPLKRLSGKTLKKLFQATGVIKKEQYSWWHKGLLWILNDALHPSTDERIDAILSKME